MFERYNESARRALFFARYEASQIGTLEITPEHLLFGLIREGKGLFRRIFDDAGISLEALRLDLEREMARGETLATSVEIPFSRSARRALELAAEEADRLLHNDIGTEHLLLGVLREDTSLAASLLKRHGLNIGNARESLLKLLSADPPRRASRADLRQQVAEIRQMIELFGTDGSLEETHIRMEMIRSALERLEADLSD